MNDPLATPPRHSIVQKKSLSAYKKTLILIGTTFALLGIAYETYSVLTKKSKPAPVKEVVTQATTQETKLLPKDVPDAGGTKEYTSTILNLKFSYPNTWLVTETADQGVRVESPAFKFVTNEKGTVDGLFRIYIRRGARATDSKYIGRGYAISASEKLAYSNPGNDQRKETLLTKFGLDEPTNFAYFFIAGNFQLNKGDTLGPNYGTEADTFIIAGGYSSSKLADDLQTYSVASEMPDTSNAYKQAVTVISSLQLN